jgi:hypothetical protein
MVGFVDYMRSDNTSGSSGTTTILMIVFLGIPVFCLGVVLICFCGYHIMLICSGETTRERLKRANEQYLGGQACGCGLWKMVTERGPSRLKLSNQVSSSRAIAMQQQNLSQNGNNNNLSNNGYEQQQHNNYPMIGNSNNSMQMNTLNGQNNANMAGNGQFAIGVTQQTAAGALLESSSLDSTMQPQTGLQLRNVAS